MNRKSLGNQGEIKAIKFLKEKGYRILEKNYRKRIGEIDIITFDPNFNEYVFTEVKTRRSLKFGYPEESVDENKILKLIETAENWLLENEKFDVEALYGKYHEELSKLYTDRYNFNPMHDEKFLANHS